MQYRPLTEHPVFVPVLAAVAVLAALAVMVMGANGSAPKSGARADAAAVAAPASLPTANTAKPLPVTLTSVALAREAGGRDAVTVKVGDRTVRLLLSVETRILVPAEGGRSMLGGPEDLVAGLSATVKVADGARFVNGATVTQITLDPTTDADSAPAV